MNVQDQQTKEINRKLTPIERFFAHSPFSIVTMVARIKGDVSEEILRNAVAKAQHRHALLRVRIKEDSDHTQWFTSAGAGEIPVEILPRKSANDWIRIHAEASRIPFEFDACPAVRFILVQSPETSELIILCHHIICDGMSLAYLARDIMGYLGDPDREVEALPAPPAIDLENLPDDVSLSGLVRFFVNRMNRRWADESVYFDQADYEILTKIYWDRYTHEILPIELSEEETAGLVARCRAEKVTVNSALSAAFGGAQSFVQGEQPYHRKFVVAANLRERLPNPPGEGMGMYAGGVEFNFRYKHNKTFWENARKLNQIIQPKIANKHLFADLLNWLYLDPTMLEAMNFKKLGQFAPADSDRFEKLSSFSSREDVVLRILRRDKIESLERKYWGAAVTNLGRLDFPKNYGALELDRLILQPGGGIPLANVNLVLGAVTSSGKLSLVVEYAREAVDTETMSDITNQALEYLFP